MVQSNPLARWLGKRCAETLPGAALGSGRALEATALATSAERCLDANWASPSSRTTGSDAPNSALVLLVALTGPTAATSSRLMASLVMVADGLMLCVFAQFWWRSISRGILSCAHGRDSNPDVKDVSVLWAISIGKAQGQKWGYRLNKARQRWGGCLQCVLGNFLIGEQRRWP